MRKLRSGVTYANVLSTTPAKLSSAAKATLTGPQGPKGEAGPKGDN